MIRSMTGFGRERQVVDKWDVSLEIRAVNHRYLDFSFRIPKVYSFLEDALREYLSLYIKRGKVEVYLSLKNILDEEKTVKLNSNITRNYIEVFEQIARDFELKNDITVSSIARFSDIFSVDNKETDNEELLAEVLKVAEKTVNDFVVMRTREGERLYGDISKRLENITSIVKEVDLRSPETISDYQLKLKTKIDELLSGTKFDEQRILTEVAIFADKISVTEETVRLKSHIEEFSSLIKKDGAIGKKLDFMLQEINREANTIGSKCNDYSISKKVVELKSEIENIREQIQNVE